MKKYIFILVSIILSVSVMAQQRIQLRSVDKAECVSSDMTSLSASFSFSTIEAQDYESERGTFSWLSLPNTIIGGNEGDPQIPVVNELIAVPFGAHPWVEIKSFSATDYRLDDYGIHALVPRQPSLRKDQRPEDVPFLYNESAYQTRGFRSEPMAVVSVEGTMRGVQLGKMTIEPVSYNPVDNTLRVFNDIEVMVHFDGADFRATEDMLVKTYSPYFDIIYKQLFNGRAIRDAYSQHPDLYTTPVKMLVVTTSTYANSTPFQNWLTWKKQKGIAVDVQTVANNASAGTIKNLIYSRYNANHPTFLVIVGDETVVTYYQLWDYDSYYGNAATDLEYASVDGDVYHDMFISRMSVSSTTELGNLVNKILTYEQYTMSDPSYLSKVLLIAGADNTWAPRVGRPTINYAANNYFNTAHGFSNVYKYVTNSYTGCYTYLSSGVGFANYTAHGDIQEWYSPNFTNSNVNSLTNNDKYFWAMGNCCLTANFKNQQNNQTCFGEAMIRAANKGAFGYIGSVPESYWYEDYYFGVGATSILNQTPSQSQTTTGVYDAMFDDTGFNSLNAVPYIGNVAVTYAHAGNYSYSVSDEYYWRAYQCFGDGSVMPYHTQPAANNVSHGSTMGIGVDSFTVNADAGSYVAITKDNEILGVAQVGSTGSVDVPVTPVTSTGEVMIVVTRNQRQPYITTLPIASDSETQAIDFGQGWNWWSSYVVADDLMDQMKSGLGADGKQIKSQSKFTMNYGTMWMGQLNSLENDQTYMIQANNACTVELNGAPVNPADYPITLTTGWKWIGYPCTESMSVSEALAGITPSAGDQIKAQNNFATYYNNIGWIGSLRSLTPGAGYMYKLNGTSQTLVFPNGGRGELAENVTAEGNHWTPEVHAYPSNMTVMAVVELEGTELRSESYELAAFANGEVRGSAKLMYVEPLDRYFAFLTIAGDEAAELRFGLYDGMDEYLDSDDFIVYATDAIVGTPDAPMVVRFRGTTGLSENENSLLVYPNPANDKLNIKATAGGRIEVYSVIGELVYSKDGCAAQTELSVRDLPAGTYLIRMTGDDSVQIARFVKE